MEPAKILFVGDYSKEDEDILKRLPPEASVTRTATFSDAMSALKSAAYDAVLIKSHLPYGAYSRGKRTPFDTRRSASAAHVLSILAIAQGIPRVTILGDAREYASNENVFLEILTGRRSGKQAPVYSLTMGKTGLVIGYTDDVLASSAILA